MLVIINADDLGASSEINDAIFEMMSKQYVTSATLLANGPKLTQAAKELIHFPQCSFGIHLNLTEFQPLHPTYELKPILDEDGNFIISEKLRSTRLSLDLLSGVLKEFRAQVDKLLSLGIKISHIDSHQHVHTIRPIFFPLKLIQKRYKLRKVRISRNIYTDSDRISQKLTLLKIAYNSMLRSCYTTKTTDGFTDLVTFYENGRRNKLSHKRIEVMVHPGNPDHAKENHLLQSAWQEELPFTISRINYNQL